MICEVIVGAKIMQVWPLTSCRRGAVDTFLVSDENLHDHCKQLIIILQNDAQYWENQGHVNMSETSFA